MRGLKYISWGDTTGYAVAAKAYVRALLDAGVDVTWTPMLRGRSLYELHATRSWPCPRLGAVCNRPLEYDTVLIHTVPEYYPALIDQERRRGRRIFGYTVWELDRLPEHWPGILNRLDGVLVPCRWNADVFRRSGVTVPVHVVPHLSQFADSQQPAAGDRARLLARLGRLAPDGRFVVYTVGFWSHRKAPYLAARAYWQAFDAEDPVLMIVKTSARDITRWHRHWRNGFRLRHPSPALSLAELDGGVRQAPVVLIADETLSDGEMLALHEMGHCFVSLARAEGWGLGAFEAARMATPVVTTGYGGHLDFLAPDLACLVDYRLVPVHEPAWSASYRPSDRWAEPSVTHAATQLRAVFDDWASARARACRLAERIARTFSRDAVVAALREAIT